MNLKSEQENSKYYYEIADVERMRQMYELYHQEAEPCLAKGLVLPAHDYILKCSHTFNVLDARGAIGITERQASFGGLSGLRPRQGMLEHLRLEHGEVSVLGTPRRLAIIVRDVASGHPDLEQLVKG